MPYKKTFTWCQESWIAIFVKEKEENSLDILQVSKVHGKHMVSASQATQQQPSTLQHTHLLGLHLPAAPATGASSSINFHHK